jgi:2-polyprenyl-6-methoxyphenol hydroxylase-like FAD-dependent oxidoreductase
MPRQKVCGCCLAPGGVAALASAGVADVLSDALSMNACELRIGGHAAILPAPGFRVIGREVLDCRLAAAAQAAGARVVTGWSARVQSDGTVRLGRRTGGVVFLRARAVIVADGLGGSSLADRPEFGWWIDPRSRMGLGASLSRSPVPLPSGQMAMLCGRFGYLGLVRLPTGEIDAAASLDPAAAREAGGPAQVCTELVRSVGGDAEALSGASWRGTPLLTRRRTCIEFGNVYVVGDAAGYVEPFTGEGMTWAIRSALLAAQIIEARLAGRAAPGDWTAAYRQGVASEHRRCGVVACLSRSPRAVRAALAIGSCVPSLLGRVATALGPKPPLVHQGRCA